MSVRLWLLPLQLSEHLLTLIYQPHRRCRRYRTAPATARGMVRPLPPPRPPRPGATREGATLCCLWLPPRWVSQKLCLPYQLCRRDCSEQWGLNPKLRNQGLETAEVYLMRTGKGLRRNRKRLKTPIVGGTQMRVWVAGTCARLSLPHKSTPQKNTPPLHKLALQTLKLYSCSL